MVKNNEYYDFINQEIVFDFYRAMQKFFTKCLDGSMEM